MLKTNAMFQGIQAGISLTNAAVTIGKAIGDHNEQKAELERQTRMALRNKTIEQEMVSGGYDPTRMVEEAGEPTREYAGYGGFKTAVNDMTLDELEQAYKDAKEEAFEKHDPYIEGERNPTREYIEDEKKLTRDVEGEPEREYAGYGGFKTANGMTLDELEQALKDAREEALEKHDPYITKEGEIKYRYAGFYDCKMEDGRTIREFDEETVKLAGKNFLTKSGKERGMKMAANAIENSELNAIREFKGKILGEREKLSAELRAGYEADARKTGDFTQLIAFNKSETWRSPADREAQLIGSFRRVYHGNIQDETARIASESGMARATEYMNEANAKLPEQYRLNKAGEDGILLNAQKSRAIAVKQEQDRLNGDWETNTANATPATAEKLKSVLQGQQKQFEACDNEKSYYDYMNRLRARGASGGSGLSEEKINDYNAMMMEATMNRYKNGQIGIDQALTEMSGLERTRWTINKQEDYEKQMMEFKDPLTARAFEEAEKLWKKLGVDDVIQKDMKEVLLRMFTNNEIPRADRLRYVKEEMIDKQIAGYMEKARKPGASWSNTDLNRQNALIYEGKLDDYFAPVGRGGAQEMEVSGATELKKNNIIHTKNITEEAIKATGLKYISNEPETKGHNDKTGRTFHILEDQNGNEIKVIVNKEGKLEKVVEETNGKNKFVPFDNEIKESHEVYMKEYDAKLKEELGDFEGRAERYAQQPRGSGGRGTSHTNPYYDALKRELGTRVETEDGEAYLKWKLKNRRR
jgi:hypothetical protein